MPIEDSPGQTGSWADRVELAEHGDRGGFAFRPGQFLAVGDESRDRAAERTPTLIEPERIGNSYLFTMPPGAAAVDTLGSILEMRAEGMAVHPNHVLFADSCQCCPPHPAHLAGAPGAPYANPVYANPVYANPVYANPVYANPVYANPVYANPVYANPYRTTGRRESSARPASEPPQSAQPATTALAGPTVAVLDTGLAADDYKPAALGDIVVEARHREVPDEDSDNSLDPAAGHGTFITGLIDRIAPGTTVLPVRVLTAFGDGDEAAIAGAIDGLPTEVDILNLSFSGYALEAMYTLAAAVRRFRERPNAPVVVASAGNDATCRPTYPAVLDGVVAVGAIGPYGPAAFSNYGPWVDACAPGVDIVSTFFKSFNGLEPAAPGGQDPDQFDSWATWSGTSFSAPIVAAAIARLVQSGWTARQAVARLVEAPGLMRIPNLGTVVNVI